MSSMVLLVDFTEMDCARPRSIISNTAPVCTRTVSMLDMYAYGPYIFVLKHERK